MERCSYLLYYFRLPVRTWLSIAVIPVMLFFVPEAVLLFAGVIAVKGVTTVEFVTRRSHYVNAKGSGKCDDLGDKPHAKATVDMNSC